MSGSNKLTGSGAGGSRMRRLVGALAMMGALAACSTHEPIEPPRGTALEAQAMVARAIAAYEMEGDAAFVAMTPPRQDFVDRDLYMFVVGPDNIVVAQGADASRVGTDVTTLVDADGFAYGQAIVDTATPEGAWLSYKREDPLTDTVEEKMSWLRLHDGYVFGCGIYAPE